MDTTVARAVFLSSLLKTAQDSDVSNIRREDANLFPKTLHRALNVCTNSNITNCKAFIVEWILPSAARTLALTKYLCVLAKACLPSEGSINTVARGPDELEGLHGVFRGREQQPPDPMFKRLHALYIVHDVLSFATLKLGKNAAHARAYTIDTLTVTHLQNAVSILAQLAVCADGKSSSAAKTAFNKVEGLLAKWEQHKLLPTPVASKLHASLQEARNKTFADLLASLADEEAQAALLAQRANAESSKWTIPKTHSLPHDPTTPWHELPAANGLFQRRTQGYPLRAAAFPRGGYSLQHAEQKADVIMQKEVEDLLAEAKRCFDKYTDASEVQDIDALGNIIWKAKTGRKRRNHWGWSYDGIEKRRHKSSSSYM